MHLHFPKKKRTPLFKLFFAPYYSPELPIPEDLLHSGVSYRAIYKYSHSELLKLNKSLTHLKKMKHENCCFLCVGNGRDSYLTNCDSLKNPPVPFFSAERKFLNIEGEYLSSHFDLFIIDFNEDTFLPSENLISESCSDRWRHGFTRGIAISEEKNLVLFWLQFW